MTVKTAMDVLRESDGILNPVVLFQPYVVGTH